MKPVTLLVAGALALGSVAPAQATGVDREDLRAKLSLILKRLAAYTPPRASTETVSCSGADGTTVSFTTSTAKDRQLTGPVRVKIGGQTTTVPALLVTTYANRDHAIEMQAYKALSTAELFSFKTELVPTTAPQVDEVATYAGVVAINGGADREVTCSAFRQGAGMLKAQLTKSSAAPDSSDRNYGVACSRDDNSATPVVSFEVGAQPSTRLISDFTETRSLTDITTFPAYLLSRYDFAKAAILSILDDGTPQGTIIAQLKTTGVRVPTNQPAADPAIYGMWSGTYQRFDAGRELNEAVTCVAF